MPKVTKETARDNYAGKIKVKNYPKGNERNIQNHERILHYSQYWCVDKKGHC